MLGRNVHICVEIMFLSLNNSMDNCGIAHSQSMIMEKVWSLNLPNIRNSEISTETQ